MNKNAQTYYAIVSVEEGSINGKSSVPFLMGEIINGRFVFDANKNNMVRVLSQQQGVLLSVEECEKIKIKDDIIRSLEQQIQQANEKLDQIGAPSVSAYGNQLTILGRLDGCVYIGHSLQSNKQL